MSKAEHSTRLFKDQAKWTLASRMAGRAWPLYRQVTGYSRRARLCQQNIVLFEVSIIWLRKLLALLCAGFPAESYCAIALQRTGFTLPALCVMESRCH